MIHLDYRDSRPIYSQIRESLRSQILCGILAQGDKLPSVRELAAELVINPNTIQRAYRELEMEGLIVSVPGKGSFVCDLPTSEMADLQPLWDELDRAASQLTALGVRTETIIHHLRQGGDNNA